MHTHKTQTITPSLVEPLFSSFLLAVSAWHMVHVYIFESDVYFPNVELLRVLGTERASVLAAVCHPALSPRAGAQLCVCVCVCTTWCSRPLEPRWRCLKGWGSSQGHPLTPRGQHPDLWVLDTTDTRDGWCKGRADLLTGPGVIYSHQEKTHRQTDTRTHTHRHTHTHTATQCSSRWRDHLCCFTAAEKMLLSALHPMLYTGECVCVCLCV